MAGFVLIKTPGLGQQNTSCDFFEAECSNPSVGRYQKLKFCHFITYSFGSSKHKQKHLFFQNNHENTHNYQFKLE